MSADVMRVKYPLSPGSVLPLTEPHSKKTMAYEILKRSILLNDYRPGLPINEKLLREEMKISKTPIREALQQLEREGLIMTVPGRGSFVTHLTLEDLREVFDSREIIECAVARRAAMIGDRGRIKAKRLDLLPPLSSGWAIKSWHGQFRMAAEGR